MINDNTPLFSITIKDKNKLDKYALFEYFSLLLMPYLSLYFTDKEINKLISYAEQNKLSKAIYYLKEQIKFHGFYKIYVSEEDHRNLFTFIIGFYDKKTKKLNTELIKKNFEIAKNIIFNTMDYLTNNGKNKFNSIDYFYFYKCATWILRVFNLKEKNKFFSYFTISKDEFYDSKAVTNYIVKMIISSCKKTFNYNNFNIVNIEIWEEIGDRDKKLIEPILNYLKKNLKCVNLEDFNNFPILNDKEENDNLDDKIIDINKIKNNLISTTHKKDFYSSSSIIKIINKTFTLSWFCYVISTLTIFERIPEINEFLNNLEFIKYVKDDNKTKEQNIEKIKNLMIFNIYNRDFTKILDIFRSKYPKKYAFLGYTKTVIQPYILFNDLIKIITSELKSNKINKLFRFTDNKNNVKLTFFLNKEKYDNNDLEKIIYENVKKTSKYFILAINNNVNSLDQKNNNIKERKDKYPIFLNINNKKYKIFSYIIISHIHHFGYDKFNNDIFCDFKITRKDNKYITDNEFKKECGFKYYYNMLVYQEI